MALMGNEIFRYRALRAQGLVAADSWLYIAGGILLLPLSIFRGGHAAFSGLVADAERPRDVNARDGQAGQLEIEGMLAHGELTLNDLVDVGQGWETLDECYLFDDACAPLRRRRRLVATVGLAVWILLAAGLGGVALWAQMR